MEKDPNNTAIGKRMTFLQLFDEGKYDIEIPIIQRDYAQGRPGVSVVRNMFLDALRIYLEENQPERDLDFVYGSIGKADRQLFIPLDGQQRLTTLFLLHWYLANKEGRQDELQNWFLSSTQSRFRYETRTSSSEFCDSLMNFELSMTNLLPPDSKHQNSLSKTIRNCNWYYLSWDNDPTIHSMLTMLDAIHEKFGDSVGLYERLVNSDNPVITFHFLNMGEFELTDDLYVKMNSRGKPLSPFENFKAKFESLLEKQDFEENPGYKLPFNGMEKNVSVQKYFAHKIDTDWANLFWAYRKKDGTGFDEMIMNFIYATALNHYIAKGREIAADENIRDLIVGDNGATLFHDYFSLGCFDEKYATDLIAILDLLKNGDNRAKRYLDDDFYYNEAVEIQRVLDNGFTNYPQRIQFYAYCQYLIRWGTADGLFNWMRVVHNLSENTQYNREEEFVRSIKSVKRLLPFSKDILSHLRKGKVNIQGFAGDQITEEQIKAHLIEKGKQWEDAIYEAEHHGYFKGQIAFLLNFSGVESYYSLHQNFDWTETLDDIYFDSFKNYYEKANAIFGSSGLRKLDEYLWERALLATGDYLLWEGSNWSFLIDNDRDISWKRLLRGDKGEQRMVVKDLFDDERFDVNDVESSLKQIIEEAEIEDWSEHFIAKPEMLEYLGKKKYIRFLSDEQIFLLRGERMSGYHGEYYSYALYVKGIAKGNFFPFEQHGYYPVKGDEDLPFVLLYDWFYKNYSFLLTTCFEGEKSAFFIHFREENGENIPLEIKALLEDFDFYENAGGMSLEMSTDLEVLDLLHQMCKSFIEELDISEDE